MKTLSKIGEIHIKYWSSHPDVIKECQETKQGLIDRGENPNGYFFLWSITGVPSNTWDKQLGDPPVWVESLEESVPVISIDLETV